MPLDIFWLILCSAGAIQSAFLSIYIAASRRTGLRESWLLSALLLAISLRLIKSIGWFFFDIEHDLFLNMGFIAHGFIGPVMVLYMMSKAYEKRPAAWMHFIILSPVVALVLASPFINLQNFWHVGGYTALLYVTVLYLTGAIYLLWVIRKRKKEDFPWTRNLFIGVSLFCISYFTNYILGINSYMLGPIAYSLIIYFISFIVFSNPELFNRKSIKKYQNLNLTGDQIEKQRERITRVMEEQHPYLNSDFNLSILSQMTAIPKHMLSRFFSENMNQNFSDFTNSYRIQKAKELLSDPGSRNHKIAFIAFQCGFNSLSSFNAAFRKFTSLSPSEFRKSQAA